MYFSVSDSNQITINQQKDKKMVFYEFLQKS